MVDYEPVGEISNDRSAMEEHGNITGILSNPNHFAGVVKNAEGELRHVAFKQEPTEQAVEALEIQYAVEWTRVDQ